VSDPSRFTELPSVRMAKRRPSSSRSTPRGTVDDAFTARVLEFWIWARNRTELLVAAVVVAVLLVGGGIYYFNQRAEQRLQAAAELETIQQTLAFSQPEEMVSELRDFLARHGGTPYAVEARLVLAEILLGDGRPSEAISTLTEVAPSFRDPLRLQATILLAVAYEEAENLDRAAEVYAQLHDRAEFRYQRLDAGESLARVRLLQGDTAAAVQVFRELLGQVEEGDTEAEYYRMRLAELDRELDA
jgi:predicted negative regulator of RcsB-dependent stress response